MALRSDPSLWYAMSGCVAAYQPVACPGGALLARSNVAHGGTGRYPAVVGAAPGWSPARGWIFSGAEYLTTAGHGSSGYDVTPWTMMIQFANASLSPTVNGLCGINYFDMASKYYVKRWYQNGATIEVPGALTTGNMAIAGQWPYLNGVVDSATPFTAGWQAPNPIWIGRSEHAFGTFDACAFLLVNRVLSPAEVFSAARQMAYCHINPDWSAWGRRRRYYYAPSEAAAATIYARRHHALRVGSRGAVQ